MKSSFAPGTRVKLTGKFLRNTGQVTGGEGRKRWTVVACDCSLCLNPHTDAYVAVDEHSEWSDGQRHINAANVQAVR